MAASNSTLIFQKTLTSTDVNHLRLSLPTGALHSLPPFEPDSNRMTFPVWDVQTGIRFDFECWRRVTGYTKPIVSGGWREYVRTKAVLVGDDVVLSMVHDQTGGGVRYYVTVFRRSVRLFGVTIPVADVV